MNIPHGVAPSALRRSRLAATAAICAVALIPALAAWLVNLRIALQSVLPQAAESAPTVHGGIIAILATLSGDLSTISTLIPVLLLLFPLLQSIRILRTPHADDVAIHEYTSLPYPAHFPFFLVMLGLTGTLYGLWMGLSVSGVSSMTKGALDAEELPAMLDRLLDGTATALLSSLIGLIGAFLAARPLPMLFEWAACLDRVEEERTLEETIDHLTHDLKALGAATRAATDVIRPDTLHNAIGTIDTLGRSVEAQTAAITASLAQLEAIATSLRAIDAGLAPLDAVKTATTQSANHTAEINSRLEQLAASQSTIATQIEASLAAIQAERTQMTSELGSLRSDLQSSAEATQRERTQLHKAFATYLKGSDHDA